MIDTFIDILTENTKLVENTDLFYLEIPLGKIGVWFSDRQTNSRFNGSGYKEFDIYYRGKTKQSLINNVQYLQTTIDGLQTSVCQLSNGMAFSMKLLYQWEFLGKDAEGYYVFANVASLLI